MLPLLLLLLLGAKLLLMSTCTAAAGRTPRLETPNRSSKIQQNRYDSCRM
jgi:hypothetical protein